MRYIPSTVTIVATALTLFGVSAALIVASNAETIGSSYTSTAPKDCHVRSAGNGVDDSTIRVCPGKNGLIVLISEDDLRESVSVGRNRLAASRDPAAQTWFGPFNSTTNTVEWRSADGRPYAIIQRWHIADNTDRDKDDRPIAKPMLAVTRLAPPGAVCHVAYIDVQANPNANELARKAADEIARNFQCSWDKVKIVGNSGRAVELAQR
jgi:sugar/nucleoside kinase (ribokinase family)